MTTCRAQRTADPPIDCEAPFCGCNPAWTEAIAMLRECGWGPLPVTPRPAPPEGLMRARVTFLYVGAGAAEPQGTKREVVVEVPHLSRAESVARKRGYPTHDWHLYGVSEASDALG